MWFLPDRIDRSGPSPSYVVTRCCEFGSAKIEIYFCFQKIFLKESFDYQETSGKIRALPGSLS
jgi:hypothetical protein